MSPAVSPTVFLHRAFVLLCHAVMLISMWLLAGGTASAHPHVFVEARTKLVVNDDGLATAVDQIFRFDDAYTAFAIQGFDTNRDGIFSREELAELAKVNVESMEEFGFFTFGDNTKVELDFTMPEVYWLEVVEVPLAEYWAMKQEDIAAIKEDAERTGKPMMTTVKLLELHFLLPLKEPTDLANTVTLDVYDPTYYVDFRFARDPEATGLINAPASCTVTRKEPPPLDASTAAALAQIGADQRELPPELADVAAGLVNQMIVNCGPAEAAAVASRPPFPPVTPLNGQNQDQSQTASADSNAEAPAANRQTEAASQMPPAPMEGVPSAALKSNALVGSFFAEIARYQTEFYQKLISALRSFRNSPDAGWLLAFLSFAYGVFHAAGPGHGKAVISSYVLASEDTLKKGILLSFASAFAQALTAILIVCGVAVVFNLTSIAMQQTARWLEIASYVMVTAMGAWLLWVKAFRPLLTGAAAGHDHVHLPGDDGACATCGHVHAPTADMVAGRLTPGRALSIILAIGLRPCSGALIVLVFALSQGMILAGIASTLTMAVGTGITVSVLATLAVGAKGLAARLAGSDGVWAYRVHRGIEIAAAAAVFLLGLTLLIAMIGWGSVPA
ncbi:nickel/cobalt efflux protein RcnA [Pannonibacter phragmitetus]|uniref:Nickel/cobalt efflux protein RcnA n=1 Tax=Pannonibacter phragmitetus TaxID=121719 RepID=A0A379A0F7_9HYPH|nr:DUF1007 family protein [Pannonibacter phragmitetus]SUB02639.1 nickel/cobalt efflux protein RcnA [Pannonibacter phragmitetus]